jgi:hypothetical protein
MMKLKWLILSLSLSGCLTTPEAPGVFQCAVHADIDPAGFYCVHTKTKEQKYLPFDAASMKGAQAVSADDKKKLDRWVNSLIEAAQCEGK